MPTCVPSFCKINLGLSLGPAREDGFHALATVYQTLAAHDLVTVEARELPPGSQHRLTLTSNDARVPLDESNTVVRMLSRVLSFKSRAKDSPCLDVSVHIDKRLPVQGGLGAGSANAAAALIGFERETGFLEDGAARLRMAAEVGSDVPLFLVGGAVMGTGHGEQVVPLPDLTSPTDEVVVVLALPGMGVSTPEAFSAWDDEAGAAGARGQGGFEPLTAGTRWDKIDELSRALAVAFCEPQTSSGVSAAQAQGGLARHPLAALVRTGIRNDFEEVVFRQHPSLGTIKRALLGSLSDSSNQAIVAEHSAMYAALSGSGSALFGLYAGSDAAEAAEHRLAALGVRSLRTSLLGRSAYWEQMVPSEPA